MRTATKQRNGKGQRQDSDWLYCLLTDIRGEVARRPTHRAIERIRGRLLAQIKAPAKAAA